MKLKKILLMSVLMLVMITAVMFAYAEERPVPAVYYTDEVLTVHVELTGDAKSAVVRITDKYSSDDDEVLSTVYSGNPVYTSGDITIAPFDFSQGDLINGHKYCVWIDYNDENDNRLWYEFHYFVAETKGNTHAMNLSIPSTVKYGEDAREYLYASGASLVKIYNLDLSDTGEAFWTAYAEEFGDSGVDEEAEYQNYEFEDTRENLETLRTAGTYVFVPAAYYGNKEDIETDDGYDCSKLVFGDPVTVTVERDGVLGAPLISVQSSTVARGDTIKLHVEPDINYAVPTAYRVNFYDTSSDEEEDDEEGSGDSCAIESYTYPVSVYGSTSVDLEVPTGMLGSDSYKMEVEAYRPGYVSGKAETNIAISGVYANMIMNWSPSEVVPGESTQLYLYIPDASYTNIRISEKGHGADEYVWENTTFGMDDGYTIIESMEYWLNGTYDYDVYATTDNENWVMIGSTNTVTVTATEELGDPSISIGSMVKTGDSFTMDVVVPEGTVNSSINIYDGDTMICELHQFGSGTLTVTPADMKTKEYDEEACAYVTVYHELVSGHEYSVVLDVSKPCCEARYDVKTFIAYDEYTDDVTMTIAEDEYLINRGIEVTVSADDMAFVGVVDATESNSYDTEAGGDNTVCFSSELAGEHVLVPFGKYENEDGETVTVFGKPASIELKSYGQADIPAVTLSQTTASRGDIITMTVDPGANSPAIHYYIGIKNADGYEMYGLSFDDMEPGVSFTADLQTIGLSGENTVYVEAYADGYAKGVAETALTVQGALTSSVLEFSKAEYRKYSVVTFAYHIEGADEAYVRIVDDTDPDISWDGWSMNGDGYGSFDVGDDTAAGLHTVELQVCEYGDDGEENWNTAATAQFTLDSSEVSVPEIAMDQYIFKADETANVELRSPDGAASLELTVSPCYSDSVTYSIQLNAKDQTITLDFANCGMTPGAYVIRLSALDDSGNPSDSTEQAILVMGDWDVMNFPESTLSVETESFMNTAAQLVVVPANVDALLQDVFTDCYSLEAVRILGTETTMSCELFGGNAGVILCDPESTAAAQADEYEWYWIPMTADEVFPQ